jgi:hypothetical protein
MKKLFVIIFLIVTGMIGYSQEETLLDENFESSGYGGPVVKFTQIKDEFGLLIGGYGGWLINHTFMIGGGGYGLVNKIKANPEAQDLYYSFTGRPLNIEMGYGGVILEYINNSNSLVHFAISTLIGGGGITYNERDDNNWDWSNDLNNKPHDAFFVVEPELKAELNIASFCRLNVGCSYRFISGVNIIGLKNSDLSGPSANITLKFGKF